MAQKGAVNTNIDFDAINAVILAAGKYKNVAESVTTEIRKIADQMRDEESLIGGNGEVIRDCFVEIGQGAYEVEMSLQQLIKLVDIALGKAMRSTESNVTNNAADEAANAAKNAGVYKKE